MMMLSEIAKVLDGRMLGDDVLVQSVNTESVKDDRLRLVVGRLCHAMSYMINSCSWHEGELHDFDYREIQSKLSPFIRVE